MRDEAVTDPRVVAPDTERVPVAVMLAAVMFPEISALPWTERVWAGEVVPMPTLPEESMVMTVPKPATANNMESLE